MLSSESQQNQKNIHAILHQRRLRHITAICIRNLTVASLCSSQNSGDKHADYSFSKLYFTVQSPCADGTLIADDDKPPIFESERIALSTNPSWFQFNIQKTLVSAGNELSLKLYNANPKDGTAEKILSWKFWLPSLAYIADDLHLDDLTFSPNALLLKINGSFYSLPQCFLTEHPHANCPHFNIDEEKISCNLFSLKRIITCHCSIKRAESRAAGFVLEANELLKLRSSRWQQMKLIENMQVKIKRLKELQCRELWMLKNEKSKLESLKSDIATKTGNLAKQRNMLLHERDENEEIAEKLVVYRKRTDVYRGQLRTRRMVVLSELAYIFPILPFNPTERGRNTTSSKTVQKGPAGPCFSICDIYLPDAENMNPKEDARNSVAMGYVCQMVSMISYFLAIPLNYEILLQGSQSSIADHITDKLQNKERSFPLFAKGSKDRFLFEYGVYLLNKNIGQILYQLYKSPQDLRPTLHNLKILLGYSLRSGATNVRDAHSSPASRSQQNPAPARHIKDSETKGPVAINGTRTSPVDLAERVHDKSAELNSLKGELFAGTKKAKTLPMSPRRSTYTKPAIAHIPVCEPEVTTTTTHIISDDINVSPMPNSSQTAALLTGLEDLDTQSPKSAARKPMDVIAARNELFSTKSGRPVFTKKHTYSMRTGSSNSTNYFSSKQQIFRKSNRADNSDAVTNGNKKLPEVVDRMETDRGSDKLDANLENNNLKNPQEPPAVVDEIDLC